MSCRAEDESTYVYNAFRMNQLDDVEECVCNIDLREGCRRVEKRD